MKTTKLLIALGIMLIFNQAFAQDPAKGSNRPMHHGPNAQESAGVADYYVGGAGMENSAFGTTGSAYLNNEWQEGVIIMNDNSVITGNQYRYNMYTQQMQFTNNEDTLAIANPEEIKLIRFANKEFVYAKYSYNGEVKQGYFERLSEGECSLLKRWMVSYHLVEGETQQRLSSSGEKEEFVRECNCFLKFGDQPAIALENRKKDFINCFNTDSEEIESYMKKGKLKHKDQQDLMEIVAYFNQMH